MKHFKAIYLVYLVLLILCQICGTVSVAQDNEPLNDPALHIDKPFETKVLAFPTFLMIEKNPSNYFVINAFLNGKGPYKFLIDTGSSFSLVSQKLATDLHLPFIKKAPFKINSASQLIDFYNVDLLRLGEGEIRHYTVAVFPEPSLVTYFKDVKQIDIDGILGYGAFNGYLLTLDFSKQLMILATGELDEHSANTAKYLQLRKVPIVPILFKDSNNVIMNLNFIIDTGFSGYFAMPSQVTSVPFKGYNITVKQIRTGMGEYLAYEDEIAANAYWGNKVIATPTLLYSKDIYGKPTSAYGLMGVKAIDKFRVTFDQKNHLIKLEN